MCSRATRQFKVVALGAHGTPRNSRSRCARCARLCGARGCAGGARAERATRQDPVSRRAILAGAEALVELATLPAVAVVMAGIAGSAGPALDACGRTGGQARAARKQRVSGHGRSAAHRGGACFRRSARCRWTASTARYFNACRLNSEPGRIAAGRAARDADRLRRSLSRVAARGARRA